MPPIPVEDLNDLLDSELTSFDPNVLIDRLFSDSVFGSKPFSRIYQDVESKLYNNAERVWEPLDFVEGAEDTDLAMAIGFTDFLNCIGSIVAASSSSSPLVRTTETSSDDENDFAVPELPFRRWTADYARALLPDSPSASSSDGLPVSLLLPRESAQCGGVRTWEDVCSQLELAIPMPGQSCEDAWEDARFRVFDGAHTAFREQFDRCFFAAIISDFDYMQLCILDRTGIVSTAKWDFHTSPKLSVRLLAGLMLAAENYVGYDETIQLGSDGHWRIRLKELQMSFRIIKAVHMPSRLLGRGTVCWNAVDESTGEKLAIRDTWDDANLECGDIEIGILNNILRLDGTVSMLHSELVQDLSGSEHFTALLRPASGDPKYPQNEAVFDILAMRKHRRTIFTPCALPLTSFRSREELLSVFIDAIEAHKKVIQCGYLHRHIDEDSILIIPSAKQASGQPRRGILSGFQRAVPIQDSQFQYNGSGPFERVGAQPFMSMDLMRHEHIIANRPRHDLESFFYLFLWVCLSQSDPLKLHDIRQRHPIRADALGRWQLDDGEDWLALARRKGTDLKTAQRFELVLEEFDPYFGPEFKDCARKLRMAFFERTPGVPRYEPTVGHSDMLQIFKETLSLIRDERSRKENQNRANIADTLVATLAAHSCNLSLSSRNSPEKRHRRDSISPEPMSPGKRRRLD